MQNSIFKINYHFCKYYHILVDSLIISSKFPKFFFFWKLSEPLPQ